MKKAIAFGDSVLKGVILDQEEARQGNVRYILTDDNFAALTAQSFNIEIDNYSKFGCTIGDAAKSMCRHLEKIRQCDFTLLEFGGNDCDFIWSDIAESPDDEHFPKTPLDEFTSTYMDYIDWLRREGSQPIMLSLPPLSVSKFFRHISRGMDDRRKTNIIKWLGGTEDFIRNWHERYNIEIFKVASLLKVPIIDITSTFLERQDMDDYICDDGMHPNEKGHRLIAEAVCSQVIL